MESTFRIEFLICVWPLTFNALNAFIYLHWKCHFLKNSLNFTEIKLKVGLSPSKNFFVICFSAALLKMIKNPFYFILKALFVLKIFKLLSWLFWSHRKNGLIRKTKLISKLMTSHLVNEQLQYTYCLLFHEVKATRQWNLVNYYNITRETFFFKNYAENEAGRLVPDPFLSLRNAQYEVKLSGQQLSSSIFP